MFKNIVNNAFDKIIKNYSLKISAISENEVILISSKYILSFLLHSGEVELSYIEKTNDGELYQYRIDSYIANSISKEEREQIKKQEKLESPIEIELSLLSLTLEKNWTNLLKGEKEWIEDFENFTLYIPPRNVTKLKAEKYKEKDGI